MTSPNNYSFHDIEPATRALSADTLQILAMTKNASPDVVLSTLALLGREAVDSLAELDAVEICEHRTPIKMRITEKGWRLIDFCGDYAPTKKHPQDPNGWTPENGIEKLAVVIEELEHSETSAS